MSRLGEEDWPGACAANSTSGCPESAIVLISTHSREDVTDLAADSPAAGFLPKTALSAEAIARLVG
jgi:hypothetical protein